MSGRQKVVDLGKAGSALGTVGLSSSSGQLFPKKPNAWHHFQLTESILEASFRGSVSHNGFLIW